MPSASSSVLKAPTWHSDTYAAHRAAVEKVICHMKVNLVEWDADLSLDALAREGCYSKSHLIDVFEEVTGTTPHHFLASLRIQKAKELLLQSNATVTEIALEVGYQSFPTFSRTFADYVGVSPSDFRKAPRTMTTTQLALSVNAFIERNRVPESVRALEGNVEAPPSAAGIIFVGTFTKGVPQGRPESGTVLSNPGNFRLRYPSKTSFHLLAALVSSPVTVNSTPDSISPALVGGVRIQGAGVAHITLTLRPIRSTDPPLAVSLLGLLT